MNHKDSWAEEERAPSKDQWVASGGGEKKLPKASSSTPSWQPDISSGSAPVEKDILIVGSRLKSWIKSYHGLNTSGEVLEELSDKVRELVDQAIKVAESRDRKTLMDRDF